MEPIWERPEPDERRAATPLARKQIVEAALRLADAGGLQAVSIRHVAAELGVRPMRLYTHVPGKDDLLELMIDAVYAEVLQQVKGPSAEWREAVRDIARATRTTIRGHPWAIDLLGGRPHLSPHAMDVGEATAAALARAPGRNDPVALRVAVGTLNAFLLGALRREIGEQRAGESSGLSTLEWQKMLGPYLTRQLATGRLPTIEKLVHAKDLDADATFDAELDVILDGLSR